MKTLFTLMVFCLPLFLMAQDREFHLDEMYEIDTEGTLHMDNDDGDARLENCGGSTFRFNIDDGDIHMEGGSGELRVDIDDGSFEVLGGKFSEIKASTDDGDLHIETSLSTKGSYEIEANDADLELSITSGGGKFYIRHDDGSIRTNGPFTMIKEDEHIMELSLEKGEGEASVNISSDDSEVSLNALR